MKIDIKPLLIIIAVCFILSGCASKQAFYEPYEGEEIGEEDDSPAVGRVAIFSVVTADGKDAELYYYMPEDLSDLSPGDELTIVGSSKKKIRVVFSRYATVISDGIIEIIISE